MGQKSSSSNQAHRFIAPLPEIYEKNDVSEVYSLRMLYHNNSNESDMNENFQKN